MMYQQRPPPRQDAERDREPWLPEALRDDPVRRVDGAVSRARPPDWYLVVDEMGDGYCQLTVDPWPTRDAHGRFTFADEDTKVLTVDRADFYQTVVDHRRSQYPRDVEAAERRIRIGDVLAVYTHPWTVAPPRDPSPSDPDETSDPGGADRQFNFKDVWVGHVRTEVSRLVDVTADARQVSHAAAEAAATGTLTVGEAHKLGFQMGEAYQAPQRGTPISGPEDEPPLQEF